MIDFIFILIEEKWHNIFFNFLIIKEEFIFHSLYQWLILNFIEKDYNLNKVIRIKLINSNESGDFLKFTYPKYRFFSIIDRSLKEYIAAGAFYKDTPIGLCLCHYNKTLKTGNLLSLFVFDKYRNQGTGTKLLKIVEKQLVKMKCRYIYTEYIKDEMINNCFEPILNKQEWTKPEVFMNIIQISYKNLPFEKWGEGSRLSNDFSIFFWKDIKEKEISWIKSKKGQPGWYEDYLSPFLIQNPEQLNSLGLKYKGEIIGWVITERISKDKISYQKLFIVEDFQNIGIIIKLLAQSIKLMAEANITYGCFAIKIENKKMMRFYNKHMKPFAYSISEKVKRKKLLL